MSQESEPELLYRYRDLRTSTFYTLNELGGLIWFGNAGGLNDPFDGLAFLKTEVVNKARSSSELDPSTTLRWTYQWCIACFSESWDDPQMWAHYGRGHTGVCLSYDTKQIRHIVRELNGSKVERTDGSNRRQVLVDAGHIRSAVLGPVQYLPTLKGAAEVREDAIFQKLDVWKQEREWRLAVNAHVPPPASGIRIDFIPALREVFVGPNVNQVEFSELDIFCRNNCPSVRVYRVEPDLVGGGYRKRAWISQFRRSEDEK
ncbi:DUF2971 domain-containing protein [uncultured Tateyamaria sp.]|uniref:DUF2971 domain-containing protein n=1 Tax=uncultured Tateyamaria sp. TaxID=455651 RepID=UPI0026313810|nr:DUF2971 domain-containing protein [uncultured Tateyamaria sp.]